ncbi:MAG: hypothetical protein Kow0062_03110 [Acidobacteriota bacterium]
MRHVRPLALVLSSVLCAFALAAGPTPTPVRPVEVKPLIALYELPLSVTGEFVTVTGVVFSSAPVDSVRVGERTATLRPAAPEDLVRFRRVPDGAADMPYRTWFEVPDAPLRAEGPSVLEVRAATTDGRFSDVHRVTVVRLARQAVEE